METVQLRDISDCVKKAFKNPGALAYFSVQDIKTILTETLTTQSNTTTTAAEAVALSLDITTPFNIGYPVTPFYEHIARGIYIWIQTGKNPAAARRKFHLLDEGEYANMRKNYTDGINQFVLGLPSLWPEMTVDEKTYKIYDILTQLSRRGVLDMLGVRKTNGTHEVMPPYRHTLLNAFTEKYSPNSILTAGARALAKHHHRDSSALFWGSSTGTESQKNDHALKVVKKILDHATWINIHELPGQLPILEVRNFDGYGARWSPNGLTFRGFLEPMMEEGWSVGYKH